MDAKLIDFGPGTHIERAAQMLVEAAAEHGEAVGKFNDIELHAASGYAPAAIVTFYNEETARRSEAYRASPEGRKAQREAHQRRRDLQTKHDWLMARLPKLDMSLPSDVLDWLCQVQECTDHIGVIVRKRTIIERLEEAGYKANENTGADYKDGDLHNMFRYLVGQALSGLKEGPAIHPIIHKFAGEWRRKFNIAAPSA